MENTKHVLITGGSNGIGYEMAKQFARNGHSLILVARGQERLDQAKSELQAEYPGIHVHTLSKNLFDTENAFDVYNEVKIMGLQVDILVNDAGQGLYGEFVNTDIHRELGIINLNISSLVILTKLFLQDFVEKGEGKILNLASVASRLPGPLQSVYHGTKAFVLSFSEAIRDEVKDTGITVTALMPGATDTDFFRKADMENSKIVQEGKLSDPQQVAEDGYKALMAGEDKVISGFMNKVQVTMSNIIPDTAVAAQLHKQQAPVGEKK